MPIANHILEYMKKGSWIRQMFEQGAIMKAEYGVENVFDFSLGNPDIEPPPEFKAALINEASSSASGLHTYMPNAGLPMAKKAVAKYLSTEQGINITDKAIIIRGFGTPEFFRIAFCVSEKIIKKSSHGFAAAFTKCNL